MALGKCRECSREISTTVKSCPHCGFSPRPALNGKGKLIVSLTIFGFLYFVFSGSDKTAEHNNAMSTPVPSQSNMVTVDSRTGRAPMDARLPVYLLQSALFCPAQEELSAANLDAPSSCIRAPKSIQASIISSSGILFPDYKIRLMVSGPVIEGWTSITGLNNDPNPPPPVKSGEKVPAAGISQAALPDTGRLMVCLTTDISRHELTTVKLPKWSLFTNDGEFSGDLRRPYSRDTYNGRNRDISAQLITTDVVILTKDAPCGEVPASMWGSGSRNWTASRVHAWDFHHVLGYPVPELPQPEKLSAIRGSLIIRAQVIADIARWSDMSERDAAAAEPENPRNRIPDDMQAAIKTVPPATGNFRVCLSTDIKDEPYSSVTVTPNVIFESHGRLIGDLRDSQPDNDYVTYDNRTHYAVITTTRFTLTKAKPCLVVPVRSALYDGMSWIFPLVRKSENMNFQALKVKGITIDRNGTLSGHLGDALDKGMLNATPVADIGNPVMLDDM